MVANKIILQRKYARIVQIFAEKTGRSYEEALGLFYDSKTFELISEGVADMHCERWVLGGWIDDGTWRDKIEWNILTSGLLSVKNMVSGVQGAMTIDELIARFW